MTRSTWALVLVAATAGAAAATWTVWSYEPQRRAGGPAFSDQNLRRMWAAGELHEMMPEAGNWTQADPTAMAPHYWRAHALERLDRRVAAETAWRDLLALTDERLAEGGPFGALWYYRGCALAGLGRSDEAGEAIDRHIELTIGEPDESGRRGAGNEYNLACDLAIARRTDEAIAALRRAAEQGWPARPGNLAWTDVDPDLEPIRDDPRYAEIRESMNGP